MNKEYRIVEQFGYFRIEEKRESEIYLDAISMLMFYIRQKEIPKYIYWVNAVNKHFSTKEEAVGYVPKLDAKYHEL